jgi:CDP-diacylglycerol--serine O-phosphatidyltransferase
LSFAPISRLDIANRVVVCDGVGRVPGGLSSLEEIVPRTLWGRRRTIDSPRPAGRWAGRLRRSGSLARQVLLVRVGRRRRQPGAPLLGLPEGGLKQVGTWSAGEPRPGGKLLARIAVRPRRPGTAPFAPPFAPADRSLGAATQAALGTATEAAPAGAIRGGERADGGRAPRPIPLLPGDPSLARRLRFAAVNGCTLASLALGVVAIFLSMHGGVRWAALCLVGCVSFDGLDGALARRLGVSSPFGAQLDSMADMCSFGIAAPVVVYAGLHRSASPALVGAACALVAVCAAIRLARFNVSPKDGRFFSGVPTTTVAAVLGMAMLIGLRPSGVVAVAALAVLALAMVSGFPYAKIGRVAKLPPWLWAAPAIGALLDYRVTFAALVALYLASGPLLWLRHRPR